MTDRLTPEREAEIAMRDLIATKGPWGLYESGTMIDVAADLEETGCGYRARREIARFEDEPLDNDPTHREWTAEEDWEQVRIDAEFVAHARTDVPVLLAELSAVRAERDTAHAELEQLRTSRWDATKVVADLESRLRATHSELAAAHAQTAGSALPSPEDTADGDESPHIYLTAIRHQAGHAHDFTKAGRMAEALEHVEAIERLLAVYRRAVGA
ncbi:hypothetical protein ABZ485_28015 [Streptomyces albogriseolus]|uniref:hypothetical protein n=1 Tax=Streptomyces albogriseolus TaxID=1887 RepID=UPI003460FDB8